MIRVKRENIEKSGSYGETENANVLLEYLESDNAEVIQIKKEIRTLIRCEDNLKMVQLDLNFFLANHYDGDDVRDSMSLEARAILSHCLMHYRACFIRGEDNLKPSLLFEKEIEQVDFHHELRVLGDKLVGHLDKDSDVRKDTVKWALEINNGEITPIKPVLLYTRTLSLHKSEILKWINHIESILNVIESRLKVLAAYINERIEIIE